MFIANIFGGESLMIVGLVVLLLFGGKKIPELFRGVGQGVGELKKGLGEGGAASPHTEDQEESVATK